MPWLDMNVFGDWRVKHELVVSLLGLINVIFAAITLCTVTDDVYLSIVCVCFVVSLNFILLQALSCIQNNWHTVRFCEMVFHWLAAVVLLFETVSFLIRTFGFMHGYCYTTLHALNATLRFIAAGCGFASSFIYGSLAITATECSVNDRNGQITCMV